VEEVATTKTKEKVTKSLRAGPVGALATLENFACTNLKKKIAICL
jgi:hypothetical protein